MARVGLDDIISDGFVKFAAKHKCCFRRIHDPHRFCLLMSAESTFWLDRNIDSGCSALHKY